MMTYGVWTAGISAGPVSERRATSLRAPSIEAPRRLTRIDLPMRALAIAATGMSAQQTNVEVIANNIANINTTGFKRGKAEFTDLLYESERLQGVSNRGSGNLDSRGRPARPRRAHGGDPQPADAGLASPTPATPSTWRINGRGWFQILGTERRHRLHPRRRLQHQRDRPARHPGRLHGEPLDRGAGQHHQRDGLADSGIVSCAGRTVTRPRQQIGQLTIANFANETGLEHLGSTTSSGRPRPPATP